MYFFSFILGAGDWNLFCTLEAPLVAAIPQDSSEWRRSYGRVFKKVFVEATFEQFSKDILPDENDWDILKQPIFHIFWTDCSVSITSYVCLDILLTLFNI